MSEVVSDESDEAKSENIEEKEQFDSDESFLLWCIEEVESNVSSFNYAKERVDSDEKQCIFFKKSIVHPKHCTK